jgi:hypothetical protein
LINFKPKLVNAIKLVFLFKKQVMRQSIVISVIFLLILSISCKKDLVRTRIDGQLLGLAGGQPIADADIYVSRSKDLGSLRGAINEAVLQTKTDQEGKFKINLRFDKGWAYKLIARKKNFFDEETTRGVQSYFYINRPIKLFKSELKLYLLEPSFINLKVKNLSNYDSSYRVSFRNIYEGSYLLGFNCKSGEALYNNLIIPADTDYYSTYFITDSQYNLIKDGEVLIPKRSPFSVTDLYLEY